MIFYQSQDIFSKPRFQTYHFILYVLGLDNDGQRHDETFVPSHELSNRSLEHLELHAGTRVNQGTNKAITIYNLQLRDI